MATKSGGILPVNLPLDKGTNTHSVVDGLRLTLRVIKRNLRLRQDLFDVN